MSFTTGSGVNNNSDDLETWNFGDLSFFEDVTGVQEIKMYIEVTNYSPYPVNVALNFSQTKADLEAKNIKRIVSAESFDLSEKGGSKTSQEILVTYDVIDITKPFDIMNVVDLINKYYGNVTTIDEDIMCEWMRVGHLFRWNYYVYKYAHNTFIQRNTMIKQKSHYYKKE